MEIVDMSKCYSVNEEDYSFTEMEEVLDHFECQTDDLILGATYWEAEAIPYTPDMIVGGEHILEFIDERAYEEIGEIYDNTKATPEAVKELHDFIITWAEKYTDISRFWKVKNSTQKTITESDIKEFGSGDSND